MNNFNSINEGLKHICNVIWGANEDYLREVKGKIKVVVCKVFCLIFIQEFKKSRLRITFNRAVSKFIDFINDYNWILYLKSLHFFDEDSWLRINISSFRSFQMSWIILTCHWNNRGRSFQTFTNRFCNWSFTNSRRSSQK